MYATSPATTDPAAHEFDPEKTENLVEFGLKDDINKPVLTYSQLAAYIAQHDTIKIVYDLHYSGYCASANVSYGVQYNTEYDREVYAYFYVNDKKFGVHFAETSIS